jgi:hypothetical protein
MSPHSRQGISERGSGEQGTGREEILTSGAKGIPRAGFYTRWQAYCNEAKGRDYRYSKSLSRKMCWPRAYLSRLANYCIFSDALFQPSFCTLSPCICLHLLVMCATVTLAVSSRCQSVVPSMFLLSSNDDPILYLGMIAKPFEAPTFPRALPQHTTGLRN